MSVGLFEPLAVPVQSNEPVLKGPEVKVTSIKPSVALHVQGPDPTAEIIGEVFTVTVTGPLAIHPRLSAEI